MAKKKTTQAKTKKKSIKYKLKKPSKKALITVIGIIVFVLGSISLVVFNRQYRENIVEATESIISTIRGESSVGEADIAGLQLAEERTLSQIEQKTILQRLEAISTNVQSRSKELFSALLSLSGFFIAISSIIENIKKLLLKVTGKEKTMAENE